VKKYFITFAAIAILGMIVIYYGPTAFKSDDTQNTPSTTASNTNPSSQPNTPIPAQNPSYKDGTYTGKDFQNPYGDVQISIVISSGKITSINLLNMPSAEQRSNNCRPKRTNRWCFWSNLHKSKLSTVIAVCA
jgi:uncharacterized protein with FMN-binding domain